MNTDLLLPLTSLNRFTKENVLQVRCSELATLQTEFITSHTKFATIRFDICLCINICDITIKRE